MRELSVDLGFVPRAHQREAHAFRGQHRFNVLVWHRRAGKTVFAVVELILEALRCDKPRGRFGYVAPFLKQAKKIAWDYLCDYTRQIPGVEVNAADLVVTLPNGAKIEIYGADNPDSIRGAYFDGVVLDEVADMKPQVWGEIIRPMLSDRLGWAIFIGTPKGVNLFSEHYFAAVSGNDPEWYGDLRRASDTGIIPEEELESARRGMSPQQYAQEFDCDFAAAVTNTLVPLASVLEAQKRALSQAEYVQMPKVLGLDFAREGDDRSCFFPRQGLAAFKPRVLRVEDSMVLAGMAAEYIDRWKPDAVFADNGGLGGPVIDRLRQLGFEVQAVNFGGKAADERFENKRAEMWWKLAEWVKGGGCLPESQELTADLTAPTYEFANDRNRIALESKKRMKARGLPSPDVGDALALTFAAPVAIRTELDRARERDRSRREYVPFQRGA